MTHKIGKSPSYLIRNPYTYCFRMNVPRDLQRYVGKKELRYSLKTGYLGLAKRKARMLAGNIQCLFRWLRDKGYVISKLTNSQIQESLVNELIGHVVESLSYGRYGKQYRVQVLYKEAILKLKYTIDLSHLKNSKYVIKD